MKLFVTPRETIPKRGSLISEFSQAHKRDAAREKHQREAGEVGELFLKAFFSPSAENATRAERRVARIVHFAISFICWCRDSVFFSTLSVQFSSFFGIRV